MTVPRGQSSDFCLFSRARSEDVCAGRRVTASRAASSRAQSVARPGDRGYIKVCRRPRGPFRRSPSVLRTCCCCQQGHRRRRVLAACVTDRIRRCFSGTSARHNTTDMRSRSRRWREASAAVQVPRRHVAFGARDWRNTRDGTAENTAYASPSAPRPVDLLRRSRWRAVRFTGGPDTRPRGRSPFSHEHPMRGEGYVCTSGWSGRCARQQRAERAHAVQSV